MRRREFVAFLGSAAAWPLTAHAQQSRKIPRIGVLWHAGNEEQEAIFPGALRKGLNELGYVEGKNIDLVNRFADEHYDRFDGLAAELVKANVDIIVASIPPAALAAKRATKDIPVIFAVAADPVGLRLVDSLAHPGGNVTGLSSVNIDLAAKHLELLKDCLSNLSTVGLLSNPSEHLGLYVSATQKAAEVLHISVHVADVRSPDELERAFSEIESAYANAVLLLPDGMFYNERKRIAQLAIARRLPMIAWTGEMADAGALMSYGAIYADLFRRTAVYIDKVLKGANPADLPVEQPVQYAFVVNLRTAKALGLTIPPTVLARADKVIE